jgi:FG-GAP repeat
MARNHTLARAAVIALAGLAAAGSAVTASAAATINPTATLRQPVNDSTFYGGAVSVSGDGKTALVGAPSGNSPGFAYLFNRSGAGWKDSNAPVTLYVPNLNQSSYFGYSVSLSGDGQTAVVGAYNATSGDNTAVPSAYVFVRPKNGWRNPTKPVATLTFKGDQQGSAFGYAVSIAADGKTILVGANSVNFPFGRAYIFTRPKAGWQSTSKPKAVLSDPTSDTLGSSVGLSANGSVAIVGGNSAGGRVYVFVRHGTKWTTATKASARLSVKGLTSQAQFGLSVAVSGDGLTALVGSLGDPAAPKGAAYVFLRSKGGWHDTSKPNARLSYKGANDFGQSVALSGNGQVALIGRGVSQTITPDEAAYVFKKPTGGWKSSGTPNLKLVVPGLTDIGSAAGFAVSLAADGKTSLAGIPDLDRADIFRNP